MTAPICVTQRTCELLLGIPSRRFRETVRRYGVPHARLGKLVMVPLDAWLAAIDRLSRSGQPALEVDAPGEAVRSVDELLGELGRRRAGGAR
jgi:hypothetical protein